MIKMQIHLVLLNTKSLWGPYDMGKYIDTISAFLLYFIENQNHQSTSFWLQIDRKKISNFRENSLFLKIANFPQIFFDLLN